MIKTIVCIQRERERERERERLKGLEKKLDDSEGRFKRNNQIFTELHKQTEADYESWEDCEKLVQDLIHDQLKITEDIQFDGVHRLRNDAKSSIIARFTYFKDEQRFPKEQQKRTKELEETPASSGRTFGKFQRSEEETCSLFGKCQSNTENAKQRC